ncbi:MAG TPA: DivIVA domain-containing protein [Acidimicrobiia bacterium]|nr:DivIVA domain-containing protein [Acidimicrobiia bacterium]
MASDIVPEDLRRAEFSTARRGLDPSEVSRFLDQVASQIEVLQKENERLASRLGEYADRDLETEFESIGREVAAVLQAARAAADSMRERATSDAERWRSEAMTESATLRNDAKNDAEALRGDAWTTGTELLSQAVAEAHRMRRDAERDVLTVMGEAEREAHRLTSTARRDAEEVVRAATMDAEKLASEAKKNHDQLIDQAHRQAEAAQERTRALEQRREGLMEELESARATLDRLEGTLDEQREHLDASSESTSVRVVPAPGWDPVEQTWELGETVRVIPPGEVDPSRTRPGSRVVPPATPDRAGPRPSVEEGPEELEDEPDVIPSEPEVPPDQQEEENEVAEQIQPAPGEEQGTDSAEREELASVGADRRGEARPDDVGALFAALRATPATSARKTAASSRTTTVLTPDQSREDEPASAEPVPRLSTRNEVIELRDARLLPITNRALRGVKKAVTDAQNVALDSLRTENEWHPDAADLAEMMRADLIGLWAESYSAGHTAAEEMADTKLKRKVTPHSDAAETIGEDLAGAVSDALVNAGDGQRERQSAASRVFRGWRTDEAERRVRELAFVGYHRGLVDSVSEESELEWVPSGTPCSACRDASSDPASHLPPVHAGCECTLALA